MIMFDDKFVFFFRFPCYIDFNFDEILLKFKKKQNEKSNKN